MWSDIIIKWNQHSLLLGEKKKKSVNSREPNSCHLEEKSSTSHNFLFVEKTDMLNFPGYFITAY